MVQISRRRLLQKAGATAIAATGIAGCLGQGGASLDSVTVAYVPIYPNMQHFVILYRPGTPTWTDRSWLREPRRAN